MSELESRFDRLVNAKEKGGDRKYTWTAEIKSPEKDGVERKYKWTAEIKDGKKKVGGAGTEKNCKWTAEIKGKGETGRPIARTYTFKASSGDGVDCSGLKKKNKKKGGNDTRVVEIEDHEDHEDHGAVILRQVFPIITDLCAI